MKNEVNRTFTVKKNKFTNFLNCFYANAPQNTGGGNSHSSTVVTPVWKGSRPTVSRRSTDSQSQDHRNHTPISKALKYAAMILMILTLGIGQMWGADQTYIIASPSQNVNTDATSGITVIGTKATGKIDNKSSQAIFSAKNQQPLYIISEKANIKGIAFDYDDSSSGSGSEGIMSISTSTNAALAVPTSGFTATLSVNGGASSSLASLSGIAVGKDQSKHCAISVSFTSAVSAINVVTSSSNAAQIRNLVITYDDAISVPDLYATITPSGANTYTLSPASGVGSMTTASVNNTTQTISSKTFYQLNSDNVYTPAESFAAGDIVVFTFGNTSSKVLGLQVAMGSASYGDAIVVNKTIAGTPYQIVYKVPSAAASIKFKRNSSDLYLRDIKVYHGTSGGGDPEPECPETLTISGTKAYTEGQTISLTANLSAGNGEITYQWYKGSVDPGNAISGATSATYSKASCVLGDAGDYYCVASKADCSEAVNASAYAVTVVEAPVSGNASDLETIDAEYTFIPSETLTNGYLYYGKKLFSCGTNALSYSESNKIKFSTSRKMAIKVAAGAHIKVTYNTASSRDFNIGTTDGGHEIAQTNNGSVEGDYAAGGVVYLSASGDLNLTKLEITYPATPCAATAPGDIEKGEASRGTGKITLKVEDDGEPVSGDAWYWQSSASSEDKTDEYDAENGKEVNAAGTYYLRSYNTAGDCWSTAKSVTVDEADLLTAISPTLSYDANVIVGNTLSPTLNGNDGSGSVTYALNDVTPAGSLTINSETGVVTAVTAGGTATVTATIAANGNYAGNTATSGTITVVAPATGTATISYALSGSTTTGTVAGVSTISSLSSSLTLSTLTLSGTKDNYSGAIKGCTSETELVEDDYVDVQFTVASGYVFTPSEVSVKANPQGNTSNLKAVVKIMDAQPLEVASEVLSCTKNTDNLVTFASGAFTNKEFCGTVHIRIYFYGTASSKEFWIKSPITIAGTVAVAVTKYNLTFAAGTGASGEMSTLKYAATTVVTLPACTFTAPDNKEFDAWVVTKDAGGASVTVTDGQFTMPAEAVTATATWKDRAKHTDATLSDLTVGGTTVAGFAAGTTSYNVELPFGTTSAPTVAATANDELAKPLSITQASSTSGDATVVVTAEDGTTTKTYTIHFSVEASKDIELVWATDKQRCDATTPSAVVKSNNAAVSTYINQITFTGGGEEGSSLNVGKNTGNMLTLAAKAGFAIKALSFYGKIESADTKLEYSLDGGSSWNDLASTSGDDACYSDVFTNEEVHTLCMRSAGSKGFWIRNMQLTMVQACTPKTIAWTTAPESEYEVGKSGYAIAASANNGTITYAASGEAITVNASTGALTINSLTNDIDLSASVSAGDGTLYCATPASVVKEEIKTYYLVTFDAQNETAATPVKYYSGDAAIALPNPSYSGYVFQGWFDASTGGNKITEAVTPSASRTIYAQWEAQCAGPTIETQPESASYFVGRTASALSCEATPGVEGKALTYTWYSCDDAERTNPVELAGAPTPSTAAVGTFYYYCAVTEEDCDVIRNSNVVTINVTEKDMLLLIQANHVKGKTATISGYIGGTYRKEMQDNSKLGSKGHYFGIKLASGTFQAGDRVYIHTTAGADTNGDYVRIFKSNEASAENVLVEGTEAMVSPNGDNWVTLPATTLDSLYLRRGTDAENYNKDWNPWIDIFAVYRPFPQPLLTGMTIDGAVAVVDELDATVYNVTIPAGSDLASLDVVPTFLSNDPSLTNGAVSGSWAIGSNTYVVTDKDGDSKSYTINITRDAAVESVTVSGETTVAAKSQITLTATVLPAEVSNKAVTWSSSDETKATVDANGVVTGKAAGSVTITATSVADNTKKGTLDITVTKFVGTERVYWFAYAADAEANGVENNSEVFGSAPTGTTNGVQEITLEEGWVVNTTKKAGSSTLGTFTVPADFTATLYVVVKGSGSNNRYIQLKQSDVVKYTSEEFGSADPTVLKIDGVAAGTYTIANVGGLSNFYLYAAELNSYPLTSVALEEGFNLRLGNSRTPVFTITPAKAALASQVWSEVSRTGASDATLNETTGEITAGIEEGTLTVKVSVTDVFGNTINSNNCVVNIVNIIDQQPVTGPITWDWHDAATTNTTIDSEEALTLANYITGDEWAKIVGSHEDYAFNTNNDGCYQGYGSLTFHTTIPGVVRITARRISKNANIKLGEKVLGEISDAVKTFEAYVEAGDVTIVLDATNGGRVKKIEFFQPESSEVTISGTTNVSTIQTGADVIVPDGTTLAVNASKVIHDLTIASKAGASGQITGTVTNLTIAGDLYMDVTFFKGAETLDETTANRWYMISAPFDVNLNGGFSLTDGTPMVFGQTDGDKIFDLFEYDGNKRATTGVTGWKRVQGKMKAGRACLIGFNPEQPTTIRLKAASTVLSEPTSITLNAYDGDEANRNWNGVANPTMHYTNLSCDVQTYNNEDGENGRKYIAYSASNTSFVVGTAFFVQATGTIDLSEASHSEFRAPQRQANERYEACVRISRSEATDFADQMYVRASENASSEYEQGHDMITWNGTTANTALIWANNYGKRLAIEEAPMVNDKATYNLGIFVPVAGTYRIEVANPSEDATLYLTKNGRIFWNLTMGACELDLAQGQNNEYGLVLRAEAPAVTTGMDEIRSEAGVQKIIIDENVFILRGEQLFDMTGKLVK